MGKFEWMGDYHLSKDPNAIDNRKHREIITDEDEMLWLRETYLPNLDDAFVSAIMYGNENHPEGFEVFKSEDADGPSEIYVRNYKPEESVMNEFEESIQRRASRMIESVVRGKNANEIVEGDAGLNLLNIDDTQAQALAKGFDMKWSGNDWSIPGTFGKKAILAKAGSGKWKLTVKDKKLWFPDEKTNKPGMRDFLDDK